MAITLTNTGSEVLIIILLMFTYFVLYKKNRLMGNFVFVFTAFITLLQTFDTTYVYLSVLFIVVTFSNLLWDLLMFKENKR